MTQETQATILAWSQATFGPSTAFSVATRMGREYKELIAELEQAQNEGEAWRVEVLRKKAAEECADIFIMLSQVSALLGSDLIATAQRKMAVNRDRRWATDAQGYTHHVPGERLSLPEGVWEFKEPGSGLLMRSDRWYLISDSGGSYSSQGFETADAAYAFATSDPEFLKQYSVDDALIPKFDSARHCWNEMSGCNIVSAADCWTFWVRDAADALLADNPDLAERINKELEK